MVANNGAERSKAEQLLLSYGIFKPDHIDLEAIAADQGAEVCYRSLGGCEARLVASGNQAIISVNRNSNVGRQRFSLAHELSHWIWDRNTGSFMCANEDIGPQNAEARSVEAQANSNASQLLLPTYLVDPWLTDRKVTLDTAKQMAEDFRVSLTAAAIKLVRRTHSQACLVCHHQSGLAWRQRSISFPDEFFILGEIHQDTDAFRMLYGGMNGLSRPKREPASRWISGPAVYRMDITSQSIKLPDGTVLSVFCL
jgi:Zn-dependent peptidase ImmA (M78 family)